MGFKISLYSAIRAEMPLTIEIVSIAVSSMPFKMKTIQSSHCWALLPSLSLIA